MTDVATDQKAEALSLREQGMSAGEVAEAIGRPASTVRRWFSEAGDFDPGPPDPNAQHPDDPPANGHGDPDRVRPAAAVELEKEAGPAVGAMPDQFDISGNEASQLPPEEIVVSGPAQLGFFDLGGKRPQKASVKFVGGKVGLAAGTAFKKGELIQFTGYATVVAVAARDKRDKQTGQVVDCELQIQAEIDDLEVTA